jgi:hypothetical protein
MREAVYWREVPCGICGELLPKHQAQFAPTGLVNDYRCWICAAKENSPNLQREERHAQAAYYAACYDTTSSEDHPAIRALLPIIGISIAKFLIAIIGNL